MGHELIRGDVNIKSTAFLLLLLLIFPAIGVCAPSVSGVSGTVSNGQTITISGTGFGATGPNVVLFDSFENGGTGSNISTSTNSADIGNWNESGSTSHTYSADYALSGSKTMKIDWAARYGSGPKFRYSNVQNSDLLISWWQYMPTNKDVPGTNNTDGPNWKWFWIGDETDGWPWGSDYVTTCLHATCYNTLGVIAADDTAAPARDDGTWYTPSFKKGTWMRFTVAMKNATSGGYIWNQEVSSAGHRVPFNLTNQVTAHSTDPWNVFTLPGYGRQDSNAAAYYDDVYVATGNGARARVEIGNASTYADSTNLALITPTSWSNTSVQATVRSGSFSNGGAYLYVIDSSGVPNALGYPITVGGGGTPDTTAPVRSLLAPSGTLAAGTTSTTLSLTTDEAALCRYSTSAGTVYASMTNNFSTEYAASHSATISGLTNGSSYTYYVRCIDGSGNANASDSTISFSVASSAGGAGVLSWQYSTYTAVRANGRIPVNIVRTGGSTGTVTAQWSSNGQTARHGVDYYGNDNVTVTFADGVTSVPINTYGVGENGIEMIPNGADDDRYFQLILTNPTGGATLGTTLATVTIEGDYVDPFVPGGKMQGGGAISSGGYMR